MPPPPETTAEKIRRYEKAIKRHNDTAAMINLSSILCFDKDAPRDVPRGLQLLERAIKQEGNRHAMQCLAAFLSENGDKHDRRRVIPLLERALRIEEDHWGLSFLSDILAEGKCGESDVVTAVHLHERALRLERTPESMERLAQKILQSSALSSQRKRALQLYKEAIRLSNSGKMKNKLGLMYYEGTPNLPKCEKRAFKWFQRAYKLGNTSAAWNLADMLIDRDVQVQQDPARALQILQDAHRRQPSAENQIRQGDIYSECDEVLDFPRAISIYEQVILDYDDNEARKHLLSVLLGYKGLDRNFPRVVQLSLSDYERTKNVYSLYHACSILWSGAEGVQADPQRALELIEKHGSDTYGLRPMMLRYENGKYKRNMPLARRLAAKVTDVDGKFIQAVILSEKRGKGDKQKAEDELRQVIADDSSKKDVFWTALSLRNCKVDLPFHGGRECITQAMQSFELIYDLGVLNLASLLLDRSKKGNETGTEVVELLEGILKSDVRVIACLNLVYVLWNGAGGVQRERERAVTLLEEVVTDTKDFCARAMLANALAERDSAKEKEIERSWDLWKAIEKELGCEEEVKSRLNRFISDRTWRVWGEYENKLEEMIKTMRRNARKGNGEALYKKMRKGLII